MKYLSKYLPLEEDWLYGTSVYYRAFCDEFLLIDYFKKTKNGRPYHYYMSNDWGGSEVPPKITGTFDWPKKIHLEFICEL
jgi:hypothetical protein